VGLDIIAFRNIKKVDCIFNEDRELKNDVVRFYVNEHFTGRADDIENEACYKYQLGTSSSYGYSGYNYLRNELAKLAGYQDAQDCWTKSSGPFWELINFSDCEGVIGASVSKKLSKDFCDFADKAAQHEDERFVHFYKKLKTIFEEAADEGAVMFT